MAPRIVEARPTSSGFGLGFPLVRVVLITGKGGTGKTTMAAITALRAADLGHRTLVVSSDAAHSLSDVFGQRIGPEVVSITDALSARELDAQTLFDASWSTIRDYLQELLEWAGAATVRAEELAVVPGLEELLALRAIARHLHEPWDAVIVDCAPTAETVRLLAFPATIGHYLEHVLPSHRRLARTLAPLLRRRVSLPPTPSGCSTRRCRSSTRSAPCTTPSPIRRPRRSGW